MWLPSSYRISLLIGLYNQAIAKNTTLLSVLMEYHAQREADVESGMYISSTSANGSSVSFQSSKGSNPYDLFSIAGLFLELYRYCEKKLPENSRTDENIYNMMKLKLVGRRHFDLNELFGGRSIR